MDHREIATTMTATKMIAAKLQSITAALLANGRRVAPLVATVYLLTIATPSVAQQRFGDPPPAPKSWVTGYAVVGLSIALGLVALCRPGTRSLEFRRVEE